MREYYRECSFTNVLSYRELTIFRRICIFLHTRFSHGNKRGISVRHFARALAVRLSQQGNSSDPNVSRNRSYVFLAALWKHVYVRMYNWAREMQDTYLRSMKRWTRCVVRYVTRNTNNDNIHRLK